jgi:hypothetical protein
MQNIRRNLTFSNVVSLLCLFLLVGGGAAYAAGNLGKNSVGTKQLKNGSITPAKLNKSAKKSLKGATGAQGAAGQQGKEGKEGPIGPSDLYSAENNSVLTFPAGGGLKEVASLTLPTGQYLLTGKQTVQTESAGGGELDCFLNVGGANKDTFDTTLPKSEATTLVGTAAVTLSGSTQVIDQCDATTNDFILGVNSGKLTALKVGTIH